MYFEYFLELENSCRLIAPSIPAGAMTLGAAVAGFAAILDAEGVAKCSVFGHSQGGIMGMVFSEQRSERVKKLILSSTCLPSLAHGQKVEKQMRIAKWVPDFLLAWAMKAGLKTAFRKAGGNVSQEMTQVLLSQIPLHDAAALRGLSESSATLQAEYHRMPISEAHWAGPVLIFETGRDRFFTIEEAAALCAHYPEATVERFEDAGHLEVVTNPLRYIRSIRRFLETT